MGNNPSAIWRHKCPPKDPANAALSFGYTIVTSELRSLLDGFGFDPYLGYYHQIHQGRPSLALDLVELYRHSFMDRLMLNLFNLSILNEDDFTEVAKGGIYLSTSGKKKFFVQYEKLAGHYKGQMPMKEDQDAFRRDFQKTVAQLSKIVKGKAAPDSLKPKN